MSFTSESENILVLFSNLEFGRRIAQRREMRAFIRILENSVIKRQIKCENHRKRGQRERIRGVSSLKERRSKEWRDEITE